MKFFKNYIFIMVFLLSLGCTSSTFFSDNPEDRAMWHNELSYRYMDLDEDEEALKAFKFAKRHGAYRDYYSRFSLGNLYIIDGSTPAPSWTQDLEGKGGAMAVIMGKKPRIVHLPDDALFAQFMSAIRPNPDKLTLETRFEIMSYLADTGEIYTQRQIERAKENNAFKLYQIEPESQAPKWIEENGTLILDYLSVRVEETYNQFFVKCQLRVDSSQQYTLSCERIPRR